MRLDSRYPEKEQFFIGLLGQDKFDILSAGFHYTHSKTDMAGMELYLKQELARL